MSLADRYGLHVSTSSRVAAEHYQAGMDRLLSYGFGADQAFAAAVAADEGFALGHAGAALFALFQGDGATARTAVDRARRLVAGATRRERHGARGGWPPACWCGESWHAPAPGSPGRAGCWTTASGTASSRGICCCWLPSST